MPAYAASEDDLELADVQETEIREDIFQAEDRGLLFCICMRKQLSNIRLGCFLSIFILYIFKMNFLIYDRNRKGIYMQEVIMHLQSKISVSNRIDWIDCAKGAAIILTIVSHTVQNHMYGNILRGAVFSFHMPLFFILSCMTFRCSFDQEQFRQKTKKGFKHLLMPAFITYIILTFAAVLENTDLLFSAEYWKARIFTLIFASGVKTVYGSMEVPALGMAWFFFALFLGRTLFDFLHLQLDDFQLAVNCVILSLIGIILGNNQWLPFSLDIVFAVMPFLYIGYYSKNCSFEKHAVRKACIWFAIWMVTLWITYPDYSSRTYLELACRRYSVWPICYLTAVAGTFFVGECSVIVQKYTVLAKPINYLGRNSLYLLCIHILDKLWNSFWLVEGHQFVSAAKRLGIDLAVFGVFMLIKNQIRRFTSDSIKKQVVS